MARLIIPKIYLAIFLALIIVSGQRASAVEHHVVGDDNGWDTSTDLNSWSSNRHYKVGDVVWFSYSMGEESVVELGSVEEVSSCDLSNPIKMYTDGLDKVSLDAEGTRFFASGNSENCKKGLKIHVNVHPKEDMNSEGDDSPGQESPPTPPKPKKSPPPPEVGPDDDSPPTPKPKPKPKPKGSPPPPKPKPHPPQPSSSTMLDDFLTPVVVALLLSYFL